MKPIIFKFMLSLSLLMAISMSNPTTLDAQCPMCRMSAESNLKNGGSAGKGLNNGILFMLATPYFIVGAIGYVWWRNRKREEEEKEKLQSEIV